MERRKEGNGEKINRGVHTDGKRGIEGRKEGPKGSIGCMCVHIHTYYIILCYHVHVVLCFIILCCLVYCIVLYCIVLYCMVLCCVVQCTVSASVL